VHFSTGYPQGQLVDFAVFLHFMKVYHGIDQFTPPAGAVVTVGTFDGVHLGHRAILNRLTEKARALRGSSVVLTFSPHPRAVLQPEAEIQLLSTDAEKAALMEGLGIDHLIIHPFTKAFSRITSLEFVRNILVEQMGTQHLVIGYDHHFGRNREGSFDHLKEFGPSYGFEVEEIPATDVDAVAVSSTKIRNALSQGDVTTARHYLTYPYAFTGTVVEGKQLGRQLGFPTANLNIVGTDKLIPADGVYAVNALTDGHTYRAMCNIGTKPTLGDAYRNVEVHLLGFEGNLYNTPLTIQFLAFLRPGQKFDSLEALEQQLHRDAHAALAVAD
jgi:riboflavin kinase/FMN adenylyltransferase